jgi:hypothetical protein
MGGGSWDSKLYDSGASFDYSRKTMSKPISDWKVHDSLDPLKIKDGPFGKRESRDSAEHPNSLAVVILFDVTGSMLSVPKLFQENLGNLMGFVSMKGLTDLQVLVGAIGDATCDHLPLQIGQFETDNRIDTHLRNILLEGGGGGQNTESYELGLYLAARLIAMDCWEKRAKKGYLFLSGDERMYPNVKRDEISMVFGLKEQADISLEEIFEDVQEKYNTYFIMPNGTSHYKNEGILQPWRKYLGQNVILLDDPKAICELIATTIARDEGIGTLESITTDLATLGINKSTIKAVSTALSLVGTNPSTAKKIAKVGSGKLPVSGVDAITKR